MFYDVRAFASVWLGIALAAVFCVGTVALVGSAARVMEDQAKSYSAEQQAGTLGIGPGYIDNLEDVSCPDAGAEIKSNNNGMSLSCECSGATNFGSETVVPITGRAETNFDGNVRSINCRSQSNSVCDCWALTASAP